MSRFDVYRTLSYATFVMYIEL